MIIDTLEAAANNPFYPPVIGRVLNEIISKDPMSLSTGKYTVEGNHLFYSVVEGHTLPLPQQRPEYHKQYADIHIVLKGEEIIGVGNKGLDIIPDGPFKEEHDIGFCTSIDSETLVHLAPSELVIIFPGELHRPMSAMQTGAEVKKIVVKIDSSLL